jgi:hypothetical protein
LFTVRASISISYHRWLFETELVAAFCPLRLHRICIAGFQRSWQLERLRTADDRTLPPRLKAEILPELQRLVLVVG